MAIVLSAKRCGSTIIQNIGHIILHGKKGRLVKHHSNTTKKGKILIPIRDPRDVAISIRRTLIKDYYSKKKEVDTDITDLTFVTHKLVTSQLNIMSELYSNHKNNKNALILRYEDVFSEGLGKYEKITKILCDFLGVQYSEELMNIINTELNFNVLKNVSDSMNTFKQNDIISKKTNYGLHGGHIKSNTVSVWENRVPKELHNLLNKKLEKYLNKLQY
jgi:hypothetical protein